MNTDDISSINTLLRKNIIKFFVLAILLFVFVDMNVKFLGNQKEMRKATQRLFWQIDQLVKQNNSEINLVRTELTNECLLRSQSAAYFLQNLDDSFIEMNNLRTLAKKLMVDEIHIFDKKGNLINGTNPEYYGMSMNSGEQISFFLPLLHDRTLSLCQDLVPNTANFKIMQYSACWVPGKDIIVQIGYDAQRISNYIEKNDIAYIFSLLTDSTDSVVLAVTNDDYTIMGSTSGMYLGRSLYSLGLSPERLKRAESGIHFKIGEKVYYGIFAKCDDFTLVRVILARTLYGNVFSQSFQLVFYEILILGFFLLLVSSFVEKNIVQSIRDINERLLLITNGDLSASVQVNCTKEFKNLSDYINQMVSQLKTELDEDTLTGIYSRRAFYRSLEQLFEYNRKDLKNAAMFMVDADGLKAVNDNFGHLVGDLYLKKVAEALCVVQGKNRIVARLGGDEFAIFVYGEDNLLHIMEQNALLDSMRSSSVMSLSARDQVDVKYSYGMAIYQNDGDNYHILLKKADERMYQDKQKRKAAARNAALNTILKND